jgi:hypothetical protein
MGEKRDLNGYWTWSKPPPKVFWALSGTNCANDLDCHQSAAKVIAEVASNNFTNSTAALSSGILDIRA